MQTSSSGNLLGTLSLPFLISCMSSYFFYTISYEVHSFCPVFHVGKLRPVELKQSAKDQTAELKARVGTIIFLMFKSQLFPLYKGHIHPSFNCFTSTTFKFGEFLIWNVKYFTSLARREILIKELEDKASKLSVSWQHRIICNGDPFQQCREQRENCEPKKDAPRWKEARLVKAQGGLYIDGY